MRLPILFLTLLTVYTNAQNTFQNTIFDLPAQLGGEPVGVAAQAQGPPLFVPTGDQKPPVAPQPAPLPGAPTPAPAFTFPTLPTVAPFVLPTHPTIAPFTLPTHQPFTFPTHAPFVFPTTPAPFVPPSPYAFVPQGYQQNGFPTTYNGYPQQQQQNNGYYNNQGYYGQQQQQYNNNNNNGYNQNNNNNGYNNNFNNQGQQQQQTAPQQQNFNQQQVQQGIQQPQQNLNQQQVQQPQQGAQQNVQQPQVQQSQPQQAQLPQVQTPAVPRQVPQAQSFESNSQIVQPIRSVQANAQVVQPVLRPAVNSVPTAQVIDTDASAKKATEFNKIVIAGAGEPKPAHLEKASLDADVDGNIDRHLWFSADFDVKECRKGLNGIGVRFQKKFPSYLQKGGKDRELAELVEQRLLECERKSTASHWDKVDTLLQKISLTKSEEGECRAGLIQERISCVNLLKYACQFIESSYHFKLVPARITIQEARQAESGAEKCRAVIRIVKQRLESGAVTL